MDICDSNKYFYNRFYLFVSKNSYIIFRNIPPGSMLNIYSISGELIFKKFISSDMFKWYARNDPAAEIVSGVYFYEVIKNGQKQYSGEIAILR